MSAHDLQIEAQLAADIADALRDRVMPVLRSHGGGVWVSSFEDGVLEVQWQGACVGCPLRPMTVAAVLEPAFEDIEGVERVEAGVRLSPRTRERLRTYAHPARSRRNAHEEMAPTTGHVR
jgi:Fe-S cluster biogenesis protein NfuA